MLTSALLHKRFATFFFQHADAIIKAEAVIFIEEVTVAVPFTFRECNHHHGRH